MISLCRDRALKIPDIFAIHLGEPELHMLQNINSVALISDAAKVENTKDLIVHAALGSDAILTVKFQMNPVSNYTIHWSMDELMLPNTNVKNTYNGEHVQTSYIISGVTKEHLGNYTVQIINWAIATEDNEVSFNLELKMGGTTMQYYAIFSPCSFCTQGPYLQRFLNSCLD